MASKEHEETEVARAIKIIEEDDIKYDEDDPPLGQGAFGVVWKGTWTCKVAIKKYIIPESGIPREVLTLASVRTHENITTLYGVVKHQHTIGIVMECAPDGSLYDYLHKKGLKPSQEQSIEWATQLARGMKHLHDSNIVHRDLKSQNILLSGMVVKICDFGTARILQHTTKASATQGTYRWMAPEVMKCDEPRINRRCDTYSYAMVLYELFEHKLPFHEIQTEPVEVEICNALKKAQRPTIKANLPQYIRGLIEICWREDPEKRLAFDQILQALKIKSVSEWETEFTVIAKSDLIFQEHNIRGRGSFSVVYKGKWKQENVAIKRIIFRDMRDSQEIALLHSLEPHPNIVTFYGHVLEDTSNYLVMELVEGVSLYTLIHDKQHIPPNERRFQWMKDVAVGMEFLHSNDIVHRDLASSNVLICSITQTAKITDFESTRYVNHNTIMSAVYGTPQWTAPEVLKDVKALSNKTVDVYSYSMVLVELVTLKIPFHDIRNGAIIATDVMDGKRPALPPPGSECPPYLQRLITTCWDEDPNLRPSFETIRKALDSKTFP